MISPSDSENAAGRDERRGHGAGIALAVTVLVLVALLGVPGFVAGELSRKSHYCLSQSDDLDLDFNNYRAVPVPAAIRAGLILLGPADWVMERSQTMRRLYEWEYRAAGGWNDATLL